MPSWPDLSQDPGAFQARKRPIALAVTFADAPGTLLTREGPVRYEAGDALLTGTLGERWPIGRHRFEETYEALPGTALGQAGNYRKRPLLVWAWPADRALDVPLSADRGVLHAQRGDVIVQYALGDWAVVGEAIFAETYERVD